MQNEIEHPVNIANYRLDLYRLTTLLLADKQIAKSKIFNKIGTQFSEDEIIRLLILTAASSRLLLGNNNQKNKLIKDLAEAPCGQFWHNYPDQEVPFNFKKACHQIVHAEEILPYKIEVNPKSEIKYFEKIITIRTQPPKSKRAEIDYPKFANICIKLSEYV